MTDSLPAQLRSVCESLEDDLALVDRKKLNYLGRCCGRKPIVYKRDPHLFCDRCSRAFDVNTKEQIPNWAYMDAGNGKLRVYHAHMVSQARATR